MNYKLILLAGLLSVPQTQAINWKNIALGVSGLSLVALAIKYEMSLIDALVKTKDKAINSQLTRISDMGIKISKLEQQDGFKQGRIEALQDLAEILYKKSSMTISALNDMITKEKTEQVKQAAQERLKTTGHDGNI